MATFEMAPQCCAADHRVPDTADAATTTGRGIELAVPNAASLSWPMDCDGAAAPQRPSPRGWADAEGENHQSGAHSDCVARAPPTVSPSSVSASLIGATGDAATRGGGDEIDDHLAEFVMRMMKDEEDALKEVLLERAALVRSISWLGRHVSRCVHAGILQEVHAAYSGRWGRPPCCRDAGSASTMGPPSNVMHRRKVQRGSTGVFSRTSDITDYDSLEDDDEWQWPTATDAAASVPWSTKGASGKAAFSSIYPEPHPGDNIKEGCVQIMTSVENPSPPRQDDDAGGDAVKMEQGKHLHVRARSSRAERGVLNVTDDSNKRNDEYDDAVTDEENTEEVGTTDARGDMTFRSARRRGTVLPYASKFHCALLFVDISGFTKLAQVLDVESLSKAINTYFEMITNEIMGSGGDVLKFAGDALFAAWRPSALVGEPTSDGTASGLGGCVTVAATCAARIVASCGQFPIFAAGRGHVAVGDQSSAHDRCGKPTGTLNLHCGLGVGEVAAVHVGGATGRREFLLVGNPIDQVSLAESKASLGEVVASPEALSILAKTCEFDDSSECSWKGKKGVIATSGKTFFHPKEKIKESLPTSRDSQIDDDGVTQLAADCERLEISALKMLRRVLSFYVHAVVVNEELAAEETARVVTTAQERHRAEAEIRSVYTMFIMPLIAATLTGNDEKDDDLFVLLNDIMLVAVRELDRYKGHLRQFIVDDKGCVLIATFGLRGSTFQNMVSERALPCSLAIRTALQEELGVKSKVGGSLGRAYCGVVGGVRRHEYAVLGSSVNLSARLMTSPTNPGILVDNAVRLRADKGFRFESLSSIRAKGYSAPVPIFAPLSAAEKRWGKVQPDFVGRETEVGRLVDVAMKMALTTSAPPRVVFVSADSGTGKSAFLVQALTTICNTGNSKNVEISLLRNVCNDGDFVIPFSLFRSIFKDVLKLLHIEDAKSLPAGDSLASLADDELSKSHNGDSSQDGNCTTSDSATSVSLDRLTYLMKELDVPEDFLDIVGHHLLGFKSHTAKQKGASKSKSTGNLDSIVDFIVRALIRCTSHLSLVMVAVDDVHLMDALSWRVVEEIFRKGRNFLIVCASRPLDQYKVGVSKSFLDSLRDVHTKELRFVEIKLAPLDELGVRKLTAKKLGVDEADVDDTVGIDLHAQSGGMPHFATAILENVKRKKLVERTRCGKICWRNDVSISKMPEFNFTNVGELIVHRMDSLDCTVRKTLSLCAVLGTEFRFSEVLVICQRWLNLTEEERLPHAQKMRRVFDIAVDEGILDETVEGGEQERREDRGGDTDATLIECNFSQLVLEAERSYRFHHDMWRSNILKMMLEERKRDVHRAVAEGLEAWYESKGKNVDDLRAMIKLFGHWKESGDTLKAASLALATGKVFEHLGLHQQGVNIYDDALNMWKTNPVDEEETIGGFASAFLQSVCALDLQRIVELHVAKGKCAANIHNAEESSRAYHNALLILQRAPSSAHLQDRSIVFPIFSGLHLMLRMGKIDAGGDFFSEEELMRRFVSETELHGDPVHFTRALALQAEVLGRMGKFREAIQAQEKIARVYDVDLHSRGICAAYGSDRVAQSFSASALWHVMLGEEAEAIDKCEFVLSELLPKMELRNVHNSMILLFPIIIIMKCRGHSLRMRQVLDTFVVQQFYAHYGEGGSTYCLPMYKPLLLLLEVCEPGNEVRDLDRKVAWMMLDESCVFNSAIDSSNGHCGLTGSSITAEICLCLAKKVVGNDLARNRLIQKGLRAARKADEIVRPKGKSMLVIAYAQNQPLLEELERLALTHCTEEEPSEASKEK